MGLLLGSLGMFLFWKLKVGSLKKVAIHLVNKAQKQAKNSLEQEQIRVNQEKETLACLKTEQEKERKKIRLELEKTKKLTEKEQALLLLEKSLQKQLEVRSSLTEKEAKEYLFKEFAQMNALFIHEGIEKAKQQVEQEAKNLLITVLGRLSKTGCPDLSRFSINVSDSLIRAKIIGKEGRNIKLFQQKSQVVAKFEEETLVLSSFDPQKRLIAKMALEELIRTGLINQETIPLAIEKASQSLGRELLKAGYEAATICQVQGLDSRLLEALGNLSLRSSYGQNLLEHSIEASLIAGLIARELKLDFKKASRMTLLHDIGKALPEYTTHAIRGSELALECGETRDIVNGIAAHHNEVAADTLEAEVCKIADALSASRPGIRMQSKEDFLKKITSLEELAYTFEQVEQAFAFESGRKMHVVVKPECHTPQERSVLLSQLQAKIKENAPQHHIDIIII